LRDLGRDSDLLRSLHVPGEPLVLPNAWDAQSARAVVAAGFPIVATTSGGVARALGYEDHEGAPVEEMLAAAARIGRSVDAPMTIDAEAGYGLAPSELAVALTGAGAAGCNLEDTDHATGALRDPGEQAAWLRSVREAAGGLVINARVDVFLSAEGSQADHVPEAVERAVAYLDAGADCVYPIFLREADAIAAFVSEVAGPVNILATENAPAVADLAAMGVARISYGSLLHTRVMAELERMLASLA
jgi:2-methylisocitrate lyase-like PEP mutase family enzyme